MIFFSCDFPVANPHLMLYFLGFVCSFLSVVFVIVIVIVFGLIDWFDAAAVVVVVVVLLFLCSFALLVIKPDMEGTVYMYSQKIIN